MANPNPQHTPTDGLGVAAYVKLSGTGITDLIQDNGGSEVASVYALTLSLSASGGHQSACVATASAVDAGGNAYTPVGNFTAKSFNDPAAGSPAWYNPSNFAGYNPSVVSAVASSTNDATITITALAVGTGVVEVAFPTFDNTLGTDPQGEPKNFVYVQVQVTVIP